MLTDQDMRDLEATACEEQWNAICDRVKTENDGQYPSDWFERVIMSGLAARTVERWKAGN